MSGKAGWGWQRGRRRARGRDVLGGTVLAAVTAETCTTQSAMQAGDRIGLAQAAQELAGKMQSSDAAGLQTQTIPELVKDFSGIRGAVQELAQHLKGDTLSVDQVYLLDATTLATKRQAKIYFN